MERGEYEWLVAELMGQYGLSGIADEITAGRVAMYLIRIVRAETYEANIGVSSASAAWGKYISSLDETLRRLLGDLAVTRAERLRLEKDDVLVDVDRVLDGLAKRSGKGKAKARRYSPVGSLLRDWSKDRIVLRSGGDECGEEDP